jgi:hypothetical protein
LGIGFHLGRYREAGGQSVIYGFPYLGSPGPGVKIVEELDSAPVDPDSVSRRSRLKGRHPSAAKIAASRRWTLSSAIARVSPFEGDSILRLGEGESLAVNVFDFGVTS